MKEKEKRICFVCGAEVIGDEVYEEDSDYPYCESCYERIIKSAILHLYCSAFFSDINS